MVDEQFAKVKTATGGAFGAGLVLIVLPSMALFFGIKEIGNNPLVGLPLLAVFGIMILFGALALIATVFSRLGLSDASQALALPEGSIRAAISLSLIVLFAIIAIMLYRSLAEPFEITGLSESEKAAVVKESANRVLAVVPHGCAKKTDGQKTEGDKLEVSKPASSTSASRGGDTASPIFPCLPGDIIYSVVVRSPPGQESTDLAKQLLILIGTLMTSVTSFYFASRVASPSTASAAADGGPATAVAVTGVSPNPITFVPKQAFTLKFVGTGLDSISSIKLQKDGVQLPPVQAVLKRTTAECSYEPQDDTAAGVWTVVVLDSAGRPIPQSERLTLTKKSV